MMSYVNDLKTWLNSSVSPTVKYYLKSLLNLGSKNDLKTYQKLYLFLNKNYNVSFSLFAEITHFFNSFNIRNYRYKLSIFAYFFKSARIQNHDVVFKLLLKNKQFMSFFDYKSVFPMPVILIKLKKFSTNLISAIRSNFVIRFSPTNVAKYLNSYYLNSLDVLYLRKNKVFNKGRYSRNRQFYRTGVYWCLYINIIAIVGLYFWFYRFVMNFGYLWWLLFLSLASFILAKSLNYNLLNPIQLVKSILSDLLFFMNMVVSVLNNLISILNQLAFNFLGETSQSYPDLFEYFFRTEWWFMHSVIKTYIYPIKFTYFWEYNKVNYYIYSITINHNLYFWSTTKNKFFTSFATMLFKK